jgi:hypothetical protein
MYLYHRTPAAHAILTEGFRDAEGSYMTSELFRGVWFADRPVSACEGAKGDTVLAVDIPDEVLHDYEWIEEGKPYREWLIPAVLANQYGPPQQLSDEEEWMC